MQIEPLKKNYIAYRLFTHVLFQTSTAHDLKKAIMIFSTGIRTDAVHYHKVSCQ